MLYLNPVRTATTIFRCFHPLEAKPEVICIAA